jgi:hypothetical protein
MPMSKEQLAIFLGKAAITEDKSPKILGALPEAVSLIQEEGIGMQATSGGRFVQFNWLNNAQVMVAPNLEDIDSRITQLNILRDIVAKNPKVFPPEHFTTSAAWASMPEVKAIKVGKAEEKANGKMIALYSKEMAKAGKKLSFIED